jgi:hypothetical protein
VKNAAKIPVDWEWGTSEGSRKFDRMLDHQTSFREKLQWLEEAETLTLRLQAQKGGRAKKNVGQ